VKLAQLDSLQARGGFAVTLRSACIGVKTLSLLAGLLLSLTSCSCVAAAPEQVESDIRVTLLGTGTPAVRAHRQGASILVEAGDEILLFDAGRGTTMRLQQAGVDFSQVDKLFLTHLHADHITGLPDLWLTRWVLGRHQARPIRIWGPEGTESLMVNLTAAFEFDISIRTNFFPALPESGIAANVTEITEGVVYRGNGVIVTAFDVNHQPIKPAFGFRIDYGGRSVVISGDTMYSENLIQYAQGVDLLIHEVAYANIEQRQNPFWEKVVAMHTSPVNAARVFAKVQPKLAVFTHVITADPKTDEEIVAKTAETYAGAVVLGEDLMVINVGREVKVIERAKIRTFDAQP
jgi:ribonuclease Z